MGELTHVDQYPEVPVSLVPSREVLHTGPDIYRSGYIGKRCDICLPQLFKGQPAFIRREHEVHRPLGFGMNTAVGSEQIY